MARVTVASRGRPGAGMGCLGSILGVIVLVAIVVAVATVGLIVLAVVAAALVVGLIVLAVDRLLLALSPKRRKRREDLMRSWGVGSGVIDTTASIEDQKPEPPMG